MRRWLAWQRADRRRGRYHKIHELRRCSPLHPRLRQQSGRRFLQAPDRLVPWAVALPSGEWPQSARGPRGIRLDRAQRHPHVRRGLSHLLPPADRPRLERYNRDIGLDIPVPNSPKISDLILKRYRPIAPGRAAFQLHFDAVNHLAHRYLVLLWYLNDVTQGGETRFPQLEHRVAPQDRAAARCSRLTGCISTRAFHPPRATNSSYRRICSS